MCLNTSISVHFSLYFIINPFVEFGFVGADGAPRVAENGEGFLAFHPPRLAHRVPEVVGDDLPGL